MLLSYAAGARASCNYWPVGVEPISLFSTMSCNRILRSLAPPGRGMLSTRSKPVSCSAAGFSIMRYLAVPPTKLADLPIRHRITKISKRSSSTSTPFYRRKTGARFRYGFDESILDVDADHNPNHFVGLRRAYSLAFGGWAVGANLKLISTIRARDAGIARPDYIESYEQVNLTRRNMNATRVSMYTLITLQPMRASNPAIYKLGMKLLLSTFYGASSPLVVRRFITSTLLTRMRSHSKAC